MVVFDEKELMNLAFSFFLPNQDDINLSICKKLETRNYPKKLQRGQVSFEYQDLKNLLTVFTEIGVKSGVWMCRITFNMVQSLDVVLENLYIAFHHKQFKFIWFKIMFKTVQNYVVGA